MPPAPRGQKVALKSKGILELDRFSGADVNKWNEISADLDELSDVLYFALEPERRRLRPQLIDALRQVKPISVNVQGWARIVDYRWTLHPLSAAGSLTGNGGRFNVGADIAEMQQWPALYIAEDHATAFREKYQIDVATSVDGLSAEDLALASGRSHTSVALQGHIARAFELTPQTLARVARVLGQITMPKRAKQLHRKLKINPSEAMMITTGRQLFDTVALHNWRVLPVQFGLPAQSHILAELIKSAGFEAIQYQSTKGGGKCIAVFVDQISSDSHIEIVGQFPEGAIGRLDESTAEELSGWKALGMSPR